ncbi:MAG: LptF/LptG family permease [Ignavibacteriales bacterium]|nr:LptF/LptG family permease [Ignavibacteriales bacterium]
MYILWRHILQRHITPFISAFLILMFIFLLQFLMKSLDQFVGKGLSALVIGELIVTQLAWMVVLAVPMAVLVATLMAFGALSSTNEVTAMRSSGVSLYRMMAPVFIASVVVCYFLLRFNNDVLPDANHRAKVLQTDIYRKKPTLSLTPGLFAQDIQGYSILVRKTFEHSNDLEGVTIFDYTNSNVTTTVTANRGTISFSPDYRKLIMDLYDGEIHELNHGDFKQYRKIRFQKHRIAMNAEGYTFQRSQESAFSRGDRELSAYTMMAIVDSLKKLVDQSNTQIASILKRDLDDLFSSVKPPNPINNDPIFSASNRAIVIKNTIESEYGRIDYLSRQIHEYSVEIQKKFAIPVACIVFVLVGAPLGIMARRGTFGVAASLSLGFFLLYWACLIGGEKLADRGFIQPWVGMWAANIIIGIIGGYLTFKTARENLSIDWSWFSKFVPKSWRTEASPTDSFGETV